MQVRVSAVLVEELFHKVSLKGKFTLFSKCIYYRAYSMVGIIIHLMCVKFLQ